MSTIFRGIVCQICTWFKVWTSNIDPIRITGQIGINICFLIEVRDSRQNDIP